MNYQDIAETAIAKSFVARDIRIEHLAAIRRLLADIDTAATRHSQDALDTDLSEEISNPDEPERPLDEEQNEELELLSRFGALPIPPDTIRAPYPDVADFHKRAMIRATAPGRVAAALASVDDIGILLDAGRLRSWAAVGRAHGISDKTGRERALRAAYRLTEHMSELDRAPEFARWRDGLSAKEINRQDWRQDPRFGQMKRRCWVFPAPSLVVHRQPLLVPSDPTRRRMLALAADYHDELAGARGRAIALIRHARDQAVLAATRGEIKDGCVVWPKMKPIIITEKMVDTFFQYFSVPAKTKYVPAALLRQTYNWIKPNYDASRQRHTRRGLPLTILEKWIRPHLGRLQICNLGIPMKTAA